MQRLIQDLLAYSRVGTTGAELFDTSSERALQEALSNLRGAIEDSGALVTHDALPGVLADESQLIQLFQNLVGNSVLMRHAESAVSTLATLRGSGVQVAIDDFGTGYSSLSYLGKFPIDALKIDQSFVGQIKSREQDATIVSAVIGMARSLELRVVAEGVETLEQLAFLRAHECDEAQGFYLSRPVPASEFACLLGSGIPAPMWPQRAPSAA